MSRDAGSHHESDHQDEAFACVGTSRRASVKGCGHKRMDRGGKKWSDVVTRSLFGCNMPSVGEVGGARGCACFGQDDFSSSNVCSTWSSLASWRFSNDHISIAYPKSTLYVVSGRHSQCLVVTQTMAR